MFVRANLYATTQVWVGERPLKEAVRRGSITLQGAPPLVRAFRGWLKLGAFASAGAGSNGTNTGGRHGGAVRHEAATLLGNSPFLW